MADKKLRPAKAASASWWAGCIALASIILGGVLIRDAVVMFGWTAGAPWIVESIVYLDGLRPTQNLLIVSIVVGLLGLVLIIASMTPRRPTAYSLDKESATWLKHDAAEKLAVSIAEDVDGVLSATAKAHPRKINVHIVTSVGSYNSKGQVHERVTDALSALDDAPRVVVGATS